MSSGPTTRSQSSIHMSLDNLNTPLPAAGSEAANGEDLLDLPLPASQLDIGSTHSDPSIIGAASRKWTFGGFECSPALLKFLLPASIIVCVVLASIIGLFAFPQQAIWGYLLTTCLGVVLPQPKFPHVKGHNRQPVNTTTTPPPSLNPYQS